MNQWRRDIEHAYHCLEDRLLSNGEVTAAGRAPAVDIKEEDGAYVLHADLRGVDPKDIRLHGRRRADPQAAAQVRNPAR